MPVKENPQSSTGGEEPKTSLFKEKYRNFIGSLFKKGDPVPYRMTEKEYMSYCNGCEDSVKIAEDYLEYYKSQANDPDGFKL